MERRKEAHFPSSHPSPLVCSCELGPERLQYLGGGGQEKEGERECDFANLGSPPSSKLGGVKGGEAICQRDFQCHRKELWLIRMHSLHPEKKICAGCKNADVCRGPAEI